jgi:hypothetical protein
VGAWSDWRNGGCLSLTAAEGVVLPLPFVVVVVVVVVAATGGGVDTWTRILEWWSGGEGGLRKGTGWNGGGKGVASLSLSAGEFVHR